MENLLLSLLFPCCVFVVSLLCILLPFCFLRKNFADGVSTSCAVFVRYCLSASAGALLSVAFLGLQPQLHESFSALSKTWPPTSIPLSLPDMLIGMGFFLVWLVRLTFLWFANNFSTGSEESEELKMLKKPDDKQYDSTLDAATTNPSETLKSCHDIPHDSKINSLFIVFALLTKDIIEGLAMGSLLTSHAVAVVIVGKFLHEIVCSFVVAIKLAQTSMSWGLSISLAVVYALGASVPIIIGAFVFRDQATRGYLVAQILLLALANGAILYTVFLEMLSAVEIRDSGRHLLAVFVGFVIVALVHATHSLTHHPSGNSSTPAAPSSHGH